MHSGEVTLSIFYSVFKSFSRTEKTAEERFGGPGHGTSEKAPADHSMKGRQEISLQSTSSLKSESS